MTAGIVNSLHVIAEIADVPLTGLDEDLLDIVALRLIVEVDDERVVTALKRIVNEVRHAERVVDLGDEQGALTGSDVVLLTDASDRSTENQVSS